MHSRPSLSSWRIRWYWNSRSALVWKVERRCGARSSMILPSIQPSRRNSFESSPSPKTDHLQKKQKFYAPGLSLASYRLFATSLREESVLEADTFLCSRQLKLLDIFTTIIGISALAPEPKWRRISSSVTPLRWRLYCSFGFEWVSSEYISSTVSLRRWWQVPVATTVCREAYLFLELIYFLCAPGVIDSRTLPFCRTPWTRSRRRVRGWLMVCLGTTRGCWVPCPSL